MTVVTSADVEKHIKGLSRKQKKKYAAIANGALQSFLESGSNEKEAFDKAIKIANSKFDLKKVVIPVISDTKPWKFKDNFKRVGNRFEEIVGETSEEPEVPENITPDQLARLEEAVEECVEAGGDPDMCLSNAVAKLRTIGFSTPGQTTEMEIFRIGTHNGDEFSESDLNEIASNFHALKDELRPKLKITHRDNQKTLAGLASYGDVVDVYMKKRDDGTTSLFAKVSNIPTEVAAFIKDRRFPERSIELYPEFKLGTKDDSPTYKNVLKAIALLGHEMPAVTGMAPVLMEECLECQGTVCKVQSFELRKPQEVSKETALAFSLMEKQLKSFKGVNTT